MKKILLLSFFLLPYLSKAQEGNVASGIYHWQEPKASSQSIATAVLFEGKAYDLDWLQLSANVLPKGKGKVNTVVPTNEEYLVIIKSGKLDVRVNNNTKTLGSNSIALLMPGDKFTLQNSDQEAGRYYVMKYRSKKAKDLARAKTAGGSVLQDWNELVFKPHDKGGRRDLLERPTAMFKRLEIHVTTLNPGLKSHEPHIHEAEEIVLVTEGNTEMEIGKQFYQGNNGSIYYLGSNVPHALQNKGQQPSTYFAIQFE
ncbi:cupin domain-containing protein [Adhaeribacter aquaticus]|uniref:cupin domain-containing protein n=1 Tax=Adhaeribacter aquaticus TaxID=299567 RepID=UPI0008FEE68F|nr:cupin domain-containing protein [Adhaeribacter aquaticus]